MKRTVESGKTLLVDGPASVMVISGKAEAFGSLVRSTCRVVIREGKRLPFLVEEKATFDIALGENAKIEEVDGSTIPLSWTEAFKKLLDFQKRPITATVLGSVDSGKTSFCTYLANKLFFEKFKVAILDGDLGQSDIGPPCTIAYTFITKPVTDLFDLEAKNAFFVGTTSPSGAVDKLIEGMSELKKEALTNNTHFIIVNTDGWIEGEDAVKYKIKLVEKLNPDITFYIQQSNELAPLLNILEKSKKVIVESPETIKQRNKEKRKNLRELGYMKYLRNAKMRSLQLGWLKIEGNEYFGLDRAYENIKNARKIYELLGMRPLRLAESHDKIYIVIGEKRWIDADKIKKVEECKRKKVVISRKGDEQGLLSALYDARGKFLGVGVLQEIDYTRKTLKVFTPVRKEISKIALGKVKLDKNLKEIQAFAE